MSPPQVADGSLVGRSRPHAKPEPDDVHAERTDEVIDASIGTAAEAPIDPAPKFLPFRASAAGEPMAMRIYEAAAGKPRGAVLIAPAMGVSQRFYAPLAGWLARRGFTVMTFDYRGSGDSRTAPLREVRTDVIGWGEHDAAAALRELEDSAPDMPITWIGHSLGGQLVPFVDHARLAKIITIGVGSGYWKENAQPLRRKVWLFWWVMAPLLTPMFGYFPGRALGMVGDLPRGVIEQWRRWCLDPDYCVGAEGETVRARFDAVTAPLTSISFTDDEMMSAANISSLHGFYRNAPRSMKRLAPFDHGLARVGHFGFFRPEIGRVLWVSQLAPELGTTSGVGSAP
jgi:predicted alpha/beta hydrolase